MVEWFKAAVLKTAGAQAPEGSNPSLSAIFFAQKKMANEAARLLFTLLCQQKLFTQNRRFSSHLHQDPEKPCLWRRSITFRLWRGRLTPPVKFSPCGSIDSVSFFTALRLNGERSRKSSLHCAKRNFTQKAQPFLHIFTKFQKPCLWSRSLRSLVKFSRYRE